MSSAVLRHIFRRPAGNFPGKLALYIDPSIIASTASKLEHGSICVVGTNGKTTVTNMLADCLVAAGQRVVCNRSGANLNSGVATSLLASRAADWGVFECDELWLVKILPYLQSRYVVLLNLFPDQLDRVGEIDRIQESIIDALKQSPETTLVYNADDPHCEKIARSISNATIPFGVSEGLDTLQGAAVDAQMCQQCDTMLNYDYRTYSQLGAFACPACDFSRAHLRFMARNCEVGLGGLKFDVIAASDEEAIAGGVVATIEAPYSGTYMVYNLLAVYTVGYSVGLSNNVMQLTMKSFDQHNGRLEHLDIHGRSVLLNLAKNPTGFNQNLGLVLQETEPVVASFFVNDMEGDGHDVSWIWDVDFEALAGRANTLVFVGGMRANDLQVRLKYAGVDARIVEDANELMRHVAALSNEYKTFVIANYTSLPAVREACVKMAEEAEAPEPFEGSEPGQASQGAWQAAAASVEGEPVRIMLLYPDLLDQGGDVGNVAVLAKRCEWRGMPVQVSSVLCGDMPDFSQTDIVVLGDGFDRQQRLACESLLPYKEAFARYVEESGVVLAIDGGLQILGTTWYIDEEALEGLGIIGLESGRAEGKTDRIVGEIAVQTELVKRPVIGFENHAGVTVLSETLKPFGSVLKGTGNNEGDATEGILYKNILGTYVHGPLLAKNPELADWILSRALERKGAAVHLEPLDDAAEIAANDFMRDRLKL